MSTAAGVTRTGITRDWPPAFSVNELLAMPEAVTWNRDRLSMLTPGRGGVQEGGILHHGNAGAHIGDLIVGSDLVALVVHERDEDRLGLTDIDE